VNGSLDQSCQLLNSRLHRRPLSSLKVGTLHLVDPSEAGTGECGRFYPPTPSPSNATLPEAASDCLACLVPRGFTRWQMVRRRYA
jgi:hypothetical protein